MLIFKNANYDNFLLETKERRVICYGAGAALKAFLETNRAHLALLDKIDYIVDRDRAKAGRMINIDFRVAPVVAPVVALDEISALDIEFSKYVFIICLGDAFVLEALRTLDNIRIFDGMPCYYWLTAISWGREIYPPLRSALPVPEKTYSIPKALHYCWFGENAVSQMEQECIASWQRQCPDYEIKLWSENNYDLSKTPLYVQQAYEAKKYAFVSDYARLDVVYTHGGVYLDTDVELYRGLDGLLKYKSFFAFESLNLIATGLGFGSVAANPALRGLLDVYSGLTFLDGDGAMNVISCPEYHTDFFRNLGITINNALQLFDDMLFLPSDYFCPRNQRNKLYELTGNTIADHKFNVSWFESDARSEWISECREMESINARLKADWKRSVLGDG